MKREHSIGLLIALLSLLSCGEAPDVHRVERGVVEGTPTVHTSGAPLSDSELFDLKLDYTLGVDIEGPEWQQFGRSPYMIASPDGWVVLADPRRLEVFIVTPRGTLDQRLGREGAGPGEFRSIWALHWAEVGQEFWIEDHLMMRVSRFSMEGEYLGSFSITEARRENAFFLDLGSHSFIGTMMDRGDNESVTLWWLTESDMGIEEPFLVVPDTRSFWRGNAGIPKPYTNTRTVDASPFGHYVISDPNEGWLTLHDREGNALLRMSRDWVRDPVTSQEKEDLRTRWRETSSGMWNQYWDEIPIPDRKPAFGSVYIDDVQRSWVARYRGPYAWSKADTFTVDVFSDEGIWIGVQRFPHALPVIVGEKAYLRFTPEGGGPRVLRYSLVDSGE